MPPANVIVYDENMRKVAYLENAFNVTYDTPLNSLWTAAFSLPADDEKNDDCRPLRYVELYDGNERLELFRILPSTAQRGKEGQSVTYKCEHVLGTLIDDVLFRYHTIGNLGVYTEDVLRYVLDQQTVGRWEVGTVEFGRQFEYTWENDTLLAAVLSIARPFDQEYMWSWDTSVYPWRLNLVAPPAGLDAYIRYGNNMQGITRSIDPTTLCTRLYCLGYGEGVNQLTIAEANGGVPYLDADTQSEYGIITRVWVDRRFDNAETLKARGKAILDQNKQPRVSYTVQASELYALTNDPMDKFRTGSTVRVIDKDMGVDIVARVVNVRKQNLFGAPGDVTLEIANRVKDLGSSAADIETRLRINETHAQGATNVNVYNLAENCDPSHPAKLRIWIPEEAARINKVLLTYENEPFRANSRAIEGGGGVTSTTTEGGLVNDTTSTEDTKLQTSAGSHWFSDPSFTTGVAITDNPGPHDHGIPQGTQLMVSGGGSVAWTPSGGHRHAQIMWNHDHEVIIPGHFHRFVVPAHAHGIIIPAHTHGINFGIYEGPKATAVQVKVDGNEVDGVGANETGIDLTGYLSVDSAGKIQRGQFHEIEITPNSLSRIVSSIVIQFFVNSRGGGDY